MTVHVDDLDLATNASVRNRMGQDLADRFGKTNLQQNQLQHTGRDCGKGKDGSVFTSLKTLIGSPKGESVRSKRLAGNLGPKYGTSLCSFDGGLQYISPERPDVLGKIATSQENMNDAENQTWQLGHKVNQILNENTNHHCSTW